MNLFSDNKKACADFSVTGLVSLTMTCLSYLVLNDLLIQPGGGQELHRGLAKVSLLVAGFQYSAVLYYNTQLSAESDLAQETFCRR
jgi:hypothetical protein